MTSMETETACLSGVNHIAPIAGRQARLFSVDIQLCYRVVQALSRVVIGGEMLVASLPSGLKS